MADQIDTAQAMATLINDIALSRHLAAQRAHDHVIGTAECIECGEEIPASRRAALPYTARCVDCQSIAEQRCKHGSTR